MKFILETYDVITSALSYCKVLSVAAVIIMSRNNEGYANIVLKFTPDRRPSIIIIIIIIRIYFIIF